KRIVNMSPARLIPAFLLTCALLAGCSPSDPQAALEAAVQQLQDNLEAKDTGAVMEQLHPQFSAQQQYDREWARRTMALLFLRHKQVRVIAIGTRSEVDPTYSHKGHTRAEVAVTDQYVAGCLRRDRPAGRCGLARHKDTAAHHVRAAGLAEQDHAIGLAGSSGVVHQRTGQQPQRQSDHEQSLAGDTPAQQQK